MDVFPVHLKQFYHSIQIQDEASFYVEILQWGWPSLDVSNSGKKSSKTWLAKYRLVWESFFICYTELSNVYLMSGKSLLLRSVEK